jgi:hypothetical protein
MYDTKILTFTFHHYRYWGARAIIVSDWQMLTKIFSSETAWPNGAKLGRKYLCKILYKTSSLLHIFAIKLNLYL